MQTYYTVNKFLFFLFILVSASLVNAQKSTIPLSCFGQKQHLSSKYFVEKSDLRSDSVDILHTHINLDMSDWTNRELTGHCELTIQSKINGLNQVAFDLLELSVDSVKINNQSVLYNYNDTLLVVALSNVINIDDIVSVEIFYHGQPIQNSGDWGGFYWNNTYAYNVGVSFLEDPHNYGRVWFPCFDNFEERSTYSFVIETRNDHKAFCNGLHIDTDTLSNSNYRWHWELNQEIPSYLASVAVANYATVYQQYNGVAAAPIPVELAARASDTTNLKNSFIHLHDAMNCYEEHYAPYAFDRVGYCVTSFTSGAMEHATNITYMRAAVNGSTTYETLMAHELSHHWWGDYITCSTAEDMWINEGWASFSEALFIEHVYGEEAYKNYSRDNHDNVLRLTHINDGAYYPVSGVPSEQTYSSTVYDKGADMAHTIRGILGNTLFDQCINDFLTDNAFTAVSTDDLSNYLSACSGMDLSSFFDTWVKEKGFHHYSLHDVNVTQQSSNFTLEGVVKQKLWETNQYTQFIPLELTCYYADFTSSTFTVNSYGECAEFAFSIPQEPVYIALDVNEKIQDATVDYQLGINSTGQVDFDLGRIELDILSLGDTAWLHATHHYIAPDPLENEIPHLHLSPNRYWSIGGIVQNDFKADAIFRYNGSISQTNGYLDNDFITNSEDSLVVLYRANAKEDWQIVDSFEIFTQGSVLNKVGYIKVYDAALGDYVLGIYDANKVVEPNTSVKCVYTSIKNENRLAKLIAIYPNPANEQLSISHQLNRQENYELVIYTILGKEMYKHRLNIDERQLNINTSTWAKGTYVVSIKDKKNTVFSQKLIIE